MGWLGRRVEMRLTAAVVLVLMTVSCAPRRPGPIQIDPPGGTFGGDASFQFAATLENGRCSICAAEGKLSTVTMDSYGTSTALGCGPGHYDERGIFTPPPECNTLTYTGMCSRGHRIVMKLKTR